MIRVARRVGPVGAVTAAVFVAASMATAAEDPTVKRGREIATAACADCHGIGVADRSTKTAAPLFRELGRKYPVESLEEALAEGVVVGHPGMPQVKMNEADIGAFIAYLKSIQVP